MTWATLIVIGCTVICVFSVGLCWWAVEEFRSLSAEARDYWEIEKERDR